jgi:hypothetical protein
MAKRSTYFFVTLMLVAALTFTFERRAYAYVDPGSGLLVFQGISAAVTGMLFYFRRRIKNLLLKFQNPKVESSSADRT